MRVPRPSSDRSEGTSCDTCPASRTDPVRRVRPLRRSWNIGALSANPHADIEASLFAPRGRQRNPA